MTEDEGAMQRKLLEILELQEDEGEIEKFCARDAVEAAFPGMSDEAKEIMARVMESEMQTPEEIERDAKLAEHNARIQAERDAKLLERQQRQEQRKK